MFLVESFCFLSQYLEVNIQVLLLTLKWIPETISAYSLSSFAECVYGYKKWIVSYCALGERRRQADNSEVTASLKAGLQRCGRMEGEVAVPWALLQPGAAHAGLIQLTAVTVWLSASSPLSFVNNYFREKIYKPRKPLLLMHLLSNSPLIHTGLQWKPFVSHRCYS